MARVDVVMPQMGESIAEGTLSKWLKKVGDPVKRDEPIFEISTDKVDAEIPAPTAGVLAEILVTEGQTVPVQTLVARIETEKGASVAPAAPAPSTTDARPAVPAASAFSPAASAPAAPTPQPTRAVTASSSTASGNGLEARLRTKSSPLVRKMAAEHGVELATMQGTGIHGRVTRRDFEQFLAAGGPASVAQRPSMHAPAGAVQHGPQPEGRE